MPRRPSKTSLLIELALLESEIESQRVILVDVNLHNARLVESNEVLMDDVRDLQHKLAEARIHACPITGELCPNCREYIWGDGTAAQPCSCPNLAGDCDGNHGISYCTYPGCALHAGEDGHTHDNES